MGRLIDAGRRQFDVLMNSRFPPLDGRDHSDVWGRHCTSQVCGGGPVSRVALERQCILAGQRQAVRSEAWSGQNLVTCDMPGRHAGICRSVTMLGHSSIVT